MSLISKEVHYPGFLVTVRCHKYEQGKHWVPDKEDYQKNLFATYMYRGRMEEFRYGTKDQCGLLSGETFINNDLTLDYETLEIISPETSWLCFSSFMPYTASFLRVNGYVVVGKQVGIYCVLGTFMALGKEVKALMYIKPRDSETELYGDAKVILIKHGEFVNLPKIHQ